MDNRVSNAQLEELLKFLREHPLIAKGVGLGPRSKETVDRAWDNLASRLNAYSDGATKTSQRWKRYWADLKHKTKFKLSKRRQDAMGTGGGPPLVCELNDMEAQIMEIIGERAVFGDKQHRVSIFPTTSQNIGEVQEDLVVIENEEFSIMSPSTRGTTDSFVGPAHASNALTSSNLVLPPSPQESAQSPIRRPQRTGRRLEKTRRTRPQPAQRNEWVVELEKRRVEAEEKLARAALITAEASRLQAQAALVQAEASKTQAKYTLELINTMKEYLHK